MSEVVSQSSQSQPKTRITIARGDGIGPEIMDATLKILKGAEAPLEYDEIEVGEKLYLSGVPSGIPESAWDTLRRNKVFLKAPITTPQGGGYKSLNVTMRKSLGLYANVRPTVSYHPFVPTLHSRMNLVIIRENEEDLYAGIEYRQTEEMFQCLKLMSRPGSEKIIRYAFEYARLNNRKKVSCFSKDNIMKMTDGMFHKVFNEVGAEYPEIEKDHWIIDIGAARVAKTPEVFDVIVTSNLYGDILSDIAAEVSGSVGIAGSANIGDHGAMFEAIHGSAPLIAGKGVANPSGLLLGAVQMLVHLGYAETASRIENAWLKTLEDGVHTFDIYKEYTSQRLVSTGEFADAVVERLGKKPSTLKEVTYKAGEARRVSVKLAHHTAMKKELEGVDLFFDVNPAEMKAKGIDAFSEKMQSALSPLGLRLEMISNRGVKVWPNGMPETFCTDHWRCRIFGTVSGTVSGTVGSSMNGEKGKAFPVSLGTILLAVEKAGFYCVKVENLYTFNGEKGYSLDQG